MRWNNLVGIRAAAFAAMLALFAGCLALPAHANLILGVVDITSTDGVNSHTTSIGVPLSGTWQPASPLSLGPNLGSVKNVTLEMDYDPAVSLGFFVTAGVLPTTFTISSAVVSFPGITNPVGIASAGVTLTDNDGDGASATGLFPISKAYEALYNTSSVFANLVTPVNAGAFGTLTTSEQFPLVGMSPIAGTVVSIQSQFQFTLSANDSASGTSVFRIAPEPSSMALALMGGLGLIWHVRRRFR